MKRKAFTLIELLVALAIGAIVIAIIIGAVGGGGFYNEENFEYRGVTRAGDKIYFDKSQGREIIVPAD